MSRSLKGMLTIGMSLGIATVALGQGGASGMLMAPPVQKELKLNDDQISKLKDALQKIRDDHKRDLEKFREMSATEQRKQMRSVGEEMYKAVSGILNDKQMKRYQQIEWQMVGPDALSDPKLQKELKLSDEQKKKLDTIMENSAKKRQILIRNGSGEGVSEKLQAIRKDAEDQTNKVLTDEQKKALKELKGEPFSIPPPGGRSKQ